VENLSEKAQYDYQLIIRAVEKNDQAAYAELMMRYRDTLYYMIFKMVRNEVDAEDLTIEAFGKAFKNIHLYRPENAFSTWIFKIATNNCIDFLRKKRQNVYSLDVNFGNENAEKSFDPMLDALNPEENTINDEKIALMRSLVATLKPRYRQLIELRYFEEYSYDEIATELDLPLGTVKAQLFRAKDLLFLILRNSKDKI
jgi:RNA polymerase sigma factor (sigma-70 family)